MLLEVNGQPAIENLLQSLPENLHSVGLQHPYNLLCAVSENDDIDSIRLGHYKLQHIVANDEAKGRIHLSGSVRQGRHIFWALREEQHAQKRMRSHLQRLREQLQGEAKFALMFPNISRGPEFYNGRDRDLELFREIFPDTPMAGFYGNNMLEFVVAEPD